MSKPKTGGSEMTPQRVKEIRKRLGMTLAEASDHVGVHIRTWQKWETVEGPNSRTPRGAARKVLEKMEHEGRCRPKSAEPLDK